jgi:hypothetical protein
MGYPVQQSTTGQPLVFLIVGSSDHITGLTGATPTVTISKNGAAFASPAGAVTEIGNGWYKVAGNATDNATLGPLILNATATSGDPTSDQYPVVAYNPQDAVHLGLTALPNTACTTNASLLTSGTGTDQLSVAAGKVLLQATQTGVTIPTVTTLTGQLTAAQIATGLWQDTTSGDFTVASSIGKSLFTSGAVPGAAGGLFIAGINAATTITSSLTTTFTGGLTGSVGSVTGSVGSVTGAVGSISGVTFPAGFSGLTSAAIATAVWTDTTSSDFTTTSSPGKIIVTQLGGAWSTTSSSVFSVASLANAPTGGSAPTVSQIATAVWQDATAGDFTTANSIGKSLYTSGAAPGAAGGLAIVGSNMGTATSVTGAVGSVTGNVGGSLVGSVGSVFGNVGGGVAGTVGGINGITFPANFASFSLDSSGRVTLVPSQLVMKAGVAFNAFTFFMRQSSDGQSALTGATVTAQRSIAGGALGACANAVSEIGGGYYQINLASTDTNGTIIGLLFTATGGVPLPVVFATQP